MKNARKACQILFATAIAVSMSIGSVHAGSNPQDGVVRAEEQPIPDRYIVVLRNEQFAAPDARRNAEHRAAIRQTADQVALDYRGRRDRVFSATLNGFSIEASAVQARKIALDPRVEQVFEDAEVFAADQSRLAGQAAPPSWGLDRIDQLSPELDSTYRWVSPPDPEMVHVYVIDTGIAFEHFDLAGRVDASNSFDAFNDGQNAEDCNGHGTHVTGTIGGDEHGVAKYAVMHPVRVLTCSGSGSLSSVIAGVDWVTRQVIDNPQVAVANMSLTTSPSIVLDNAIRASIASGVTYVAAAGNSDTRACFFSPARINEVITVGATSPDDLRTTWSNFGDCVDLYAPGSGITSAYIGSEDATATLSGTSMAAAHVSGIAANLLAQAPGASPEQIETAIVDYAGSMTNPLDSDGESPLAYSLIDLQLDPALGTEVVFRFGFEN